MILFANMDQGRHWWGKRVAERGRTRTLTVLNIHPFILFIFLALVQCRVMRLEPFLAHRQKTPWTDAQCPRASSSPQRERAFVRPLHSTWSASLCCERHDLVWCEWWRNRWQPDAKVLSGSVTDIALLLSSSSCNARLRGAHPHHDKAVNELGLKWSPLRSYIAAGWTSVFSRGAIKPPTNVRPPSSPKFIQAHGIMARRATSALAGHAYSTAAPYGCALGLPGQYARQWGSRSGCSFTQGPEERDRPGSTCHQSHRPGSIRAPPLDHDDGDNRGGQSSLPRHSGFFRQPVWTSCGGLCWRLHGGSEVLRGPWCHT